MTALPACPECLFTKCSGQMNTCLAQPKCAALVQCVQACPAGDEPCQNACINAHQDGVFAGLPVVQCSNAAGGCMNECGKIGP